MIEINRSRVEAGGSTVGSEPLNLCDAPSFPATFCEAGIQAGIGTVVSNNSARSNGGDGIAVNYASTVLNNFRMSIHSVSLGEIAEKRPIRGLSGRTLRF